MAKVASGDVKGKAATSHANILVSPGTLILGETCYQVDIQITCNSLGREPHGRRVLVDCPNKPPAAPVPRKSESPQMPEPIGFLDDPPKLPSH
jgi:hypothetical protein